MGTDKNVFVEFFNRMGVRYKDDPKSYDTLDCLVVNETSFLFDHHGIFIGTVGNEYNDVEPREVTK